MRQTTGGTTAKHTLADLRQRQALPLDAKIMLTKRRISEWAEHWDGDVYVSWSRGNNSTILAHLARQVIPDVRLVYSRTGLEYPEVDQFNPFGPENIIVVRPEVTFRQVLERHGYPVISRRIAKMLRWMQNPSEKNVQARRLTMEGIMANGEPASSRAKLPKKYHRWIQAPFKCSEACCDLLKKNPLKKFAKENSAKRMGAHGVRLRAARIRGAQPRMQRLHRAPRHDRGHAYGHLDRAGLPGVPPA